MTPLETYLKELHQIRSTGAAVAETSFYPALSSLFNEIGKSLRPKVRCVINIANRGAGLPDGGFFTAEQFQRSADAEPRRGQLPERGALEVKPPSLDVREIIATEQVNRYCVEYGIVLVTNYREFVLVARGHDGRLSPLEGFRLADDEPELWAASAHPHRTASTIGEQFCEFIRRALLANAPLSDPQDVAWFIASYARDARARVEARKDLSALAAVRDALENALGMKFTGSQGEHFFRSTLVQTLFYGVFSAWVLWHRQRPARSDAFNWQVADWFLHVPFIRTLYHQIASPDRLGPLGLVEVLDWTAGALNRVDRATFFQRFHDEHAVQYFYEPFLESFDPQLRKELGVWYTPPEIVQYQVARVDTVLREELGLADGLADPNVVVLDPCCGTGAYLVEVLNQIARTLRERGGDALVAADLKQAAMKRVFGFEILPAPFVVSHLQLGLMLQRLGAPLNADAGERVGVYLTNALTGWEPPGEPQRLLFPELAAERDAAEKVKQHAKVLVVLGNPPYNAFAGVSPEEEQGLVEPYKVGLNISVTQGGWGIRKFNLDDLYVRFFRLAERRIAEMTGKGVVSFISSFSYLSDPSFVVMRQRYLSEFDKFWFDCMNGNSRETGKLTPDGKPDPSVFSTAHNREGIRVGTAVCVIVRKEERDKKPTVRFRHFWGASKRADLVASLRVRSFDRSYKIAVPKETNKFSFRPLKISKDYERWPKVTEIAAKHPHNGPVERRGNSLIVLPDEIGKLQSVRAYLDTSLHDAEVAALEPRFMKSSGEFDAPSCRAALKGRVAFDPQSITRYPFKPFDVRVAYLDPDIAPLFSRPSPLLIKHARIPANHFFITRDTADKTPEGPPFLFSRLICDYDCISGHARHFPMYVLGNPKKNGGLKSLFVEEEEEPYTLANLSRNARLYLRELEMANPDNQIQLAEVPWLHALAIGYSPAYLSENADGISQDWARIPLPASRAALVASADLGLRIAALLDTEAEVPGVSASRLEPVFQTIGALARAGGGALDPDAGDLALTVGWGHAGKGGVTMPGKGRIVQRPYDQSERDAIAKAAAARGFSLDQALALLGAHTNDVYLNDKACWRNVPANVWNCYIGGYQVIKKWLSYREEELLGRALRAHEAREAAAIARRLSAVVLLQPELDANYQNAKQSAYPWPGS